MKFKNNKKKANCWTWDELKLCSGVVWRLSSFNSSSDEKDWAAAWQYALHEPAVCPGRKKNINSILDWINKNPATGYSALHGIF